MNLSTIQKRLMGITIGLIGLIAIVIWLMISLDFSRTLTGYVNGTLIMAQYGSEAKANIRFENLPATAVIEGSTINIHVRGLEIPNFCEPCDYYVYEYTVESNASHFGPNHHAKASESWDNYGLIRTGGERLEGHHLSSLMPQENQKVEPGDETIIDVYNQGGDHYTVRVQCLLVNRAQTPVIRILENRFEFFPGEAPGAPLTNAPTVNSN
jgi:hypothetical protein